MACCRQTVESCPALGPDARVWERTLRPKQCVLARNSSLRRIVARKLQEDWLPEQIAGWLKCTYKNDRAMQLSLETIYRSLFIQARAVLKKALISHLRSRRMMRRGKHSTTAGQPRGQSVDAVSISERPPEVEDRAMAFPICHVGACRGEGHE